MPAPAARSAPEPRALLWMVFAATAMLLGILAVLTMSAHGAPTSMEVSAHRWALSHRSAVMVDVAVVVTTSGTSWAAYSLAAVAGALADRRFWWRGAVAGVLILAAGQALRMALAAVIGRERPSPADWAWTASGPAMPSGHTTTSAIVAVLLAVGLARRVPGRGRPWACAAPLLWAVAVGATRVYLGMHWPGDVLAGWLLAAAWTSLLGALALRHEQHLTAAISSNSPQGRTT
ncbi:phosphatase PAP2 family protein [Streptomyces sp900116325]|uniref:phosphatase PAP2 family protein n=1 Tax=Streptomyces sp. 900116325 TaxID=3154295 RepID=UPI00339F0599